ncbi:PQQ-binding-like beta-propeller repeat protein [Plantactinospora sp. WMMC1484]|uniref:outer membrane protein assembly factor BamB family protein n=1 Tax=Plantactinospora sp. WMMC1484 TaxID=3404122 RepID=UPI003BF5E2E7
MVIDLGTERYEPPVDTAGPPRAVVVRQWRIAAAALAGILVLNTGGAAPAPTPPLRQVYAAPIGPVDTFTMAGGLLVTASVLDGADRPGRRITCYDLTDGRRLWSGDFVVDRDGDGPIFSDGLLLISERLADGAPTRTTALDPRTGRRRWSAPYRPLPLPDGPIALVFDNVFRPEARVWPGQRTVGGKVYIASDGHAYTEPPTGMTVRGLDLGTGRLRWELPRLDSARVVEAAGEHPTILLTSSVDGGVEVRDVVSGAVTHRLDWTGGELVHGQRIGDVVVATAQSGTDLVVTAYSADLRRRRWSRSLPGPDQSVERCGPLLCQWAAFRTSALDPATGEARWERPGPRNLLSIGPWLVELDNGPLRRVLDARTGRPVTDLGGWWLAGDPGWSGAGTLPADPPPLVLQPNLVKQHTWFGVFDPAGPSVRLLEVLPHSLHGCVAADRFMACRSGDGQLRAWRYEPN